MYWLQLAAAQDWADAMHWLGTINAEAGRSTRAPEERERHNNLAVMWIVRAAAAGHVIAPQQMAGLMPGTGAESPPLQAR